MSALTIDPSPLREVGCILLPGDAGYEAACTPWNLAFPLRPAAVAVPRSVDDVVAAVTAADRLGLRIAPQSTGHAASTIAPAVGDDTLLVRLSELTGVTVDVAARTARVVGGTVWREVVEAVAPHGLTAVHGSAGDVAVAGYVLGGGVSFYGRRHGLATGGARAFEVVTASGRLVRATADEHPELFWALRGGGGNFGVVVALELDLLPITDLVAGMLLWDLDRAPEVLRAWNDWSATAPDAATTSLRMMRFPPIPELPPFISGRRLIVVDGAILTDDEEAADLLAPLRALAPELDTFARIPAAGLLEVHMDPPQPSPAVSDHTLLDDLDDAGLDALLGAAGPDAESAPMIVELRQLGGALAGGHDGALPGLGGRFAVYTVAMAPTPEAFAAGQRSTAAVVDAVRPWAAATVFANFSDRTKPASDLFDADVVARLAAVRDEYDPRRRMLAAHEV
ncbi:FAD-linked oxidase [Microbacterium mangrovi]|uniref:FAD-linked oxidase n=1 Tax=Microbacterium mangrovi TaxID=1348253 RepID=A0A0B2A7R8_9MICO|nr:FAD-binding protein [Microbacterium mangrovi]KHK99559.1 FAD-linked oxidase [Microbacterium mangrovi]